MRIFSKFSLFFSESAGITERILPLPGQTAHIMKHKSVHFPIPEAKAVQILLAELPVILIFAVALLVSYLNDRAIDPVGSAYYYAELLQYIVASLVITTATTLVADLIVREANARGN